MSRYLTPARVCTLILIELYQSNDFWIYHSNTCRTVLALIARQALHTTDPNVDLKSITNLPSDVLAWATPLASLDAELPGRSWLSILVRELWRVQTVDDFHDLFGRCMQLLVMSEMDQVLITDDSRPPMITRASPVGQFVRRCNVEFTRLQFADILSLWHAFIAYREPSRTLWTQQYPELARTTPTETPQRGALTSSALVAIDTIDTVLNASISQLQRIGQRVPREVYTKLQDWLRAQQASKAQPLQHFMSFFDTWRAGQYNLALENLHRYFDYSVAKGTGDDVKVYYQYALLHLSVLHADFEHWEESVSAMKECIATARENQDTACLNFALSWLLYLRQCRHANTNDALQSLAAIAGEGGSERDEINFLKARARDSKHWTLMSSTLLEEAKYELRHNGVCAKATELVLQSSYLNIQHGSLSMMPATTAYQAAMYDRLGQAHLSRSLQSSVLATKGKLGTMTDRTRIVCRLAHEAAQRGRYADALKMIRDTQPQVEGILKLEQRLTTYADLLTLMRAIRRSDLPTAQYHMTNLRGIREVAEPDIAGLIDQLEVALMKKQQRLDLALAKVNASIEKAKLDGDNDVGCMVQLLIQKANIFSAAGRSAKGFSIALRAATTAQRCHLVTEFLEALHAVAYILNDMSEFDAAQKLCEAALPHALEGSNTFVTAQLFVTLGEASVGKITAKDDITKTQQAQLAHIASAHIERAREYYRQIDEYEGQLDCLLMQARLARFADDEQSAASADAKYEQLVVEHNEKH